MRSPIYASAFLSPSLFSQPRFLALCAIFLIVCVLLPRRTTWQAIDSTCYTRIFVFIIAAMFAWTYSTYQFNFYYNQSHLWDRLLLLGLLGLLWVHPVFVMPFTFLVLCIIQQALHPLPWATWIWPDKRLPLDVLILFNSFFLVQSFLPRKRHLFALLAFSLTGATYFQAAISKLAILQPSFTWLFENSLSNLFVSAYRVGGWLGFLSEDNITFLAGWLAWLDRPLGVATLLIEASALLLLSSRRVSRLCLLGFVIMHTGILMSTGIFFWKWIIFDLALLWYACRLDDRDRERDRNSVRNSPLSAEFWNGRLFCRESFLISVFVIVPGATSFYAGSVRLVG